MADQRTTAIGELMQIILSDKHCSGLSKTANNFGIFGGYSVFVQGAGRSCANARRIDQILQSNWNPVERASPFARRNLLPTCPRFHQRRLGHDGNEGIERWIQFLDALQTRARDLNGRDFASAHPRGKVRNAGEYVHRQRVPLYREPWCAFGSSLVLFWDFCACGFFSTLQS